MDGRDVSGFIARSADAVLEYIEAMRYVTDPPLGVSVTGVRRCAVGEGYAVLHLESQLQDASGLMLMVDGDVLDEDEAGFTRYDEISRTIVVRPPDAVLDMLSVSGTKVSVLTDMGFLIRAVADFYRRYGDMLAHPERRLEPSKPEYPSGSSPSAEQISAVSCVLSNGMSYVWGAPGTGKTQYVLATCIRACLDAGGRVAVFAPTNNSVEQVLSGILKAFEGDGSLCEGIIRLGIPSKGFLEDHPDYPALLRNKILQAAYPLFRANTTAAIRTSPEDTLIYRRTMEKLLPLSDRPAGEIMKAAAEALYGTPYAGGTLEGDPEVLTVNLRETDCILLVEACTAMTLLLKDNDGKGVPPFEDFCSMLRTLRYRDGITAGYPSRLHYTSEWLLQAQDNGFLREVTAELGGTPLHQEFSFMSSHRDNYPRLREEDGALKLIRRSEERLDTAAAYFSVPSEKIPEIEDNIQDGDIICFLSTTPGLDITHTGIACRGKDGSLHFIHASMKEGKVVLERKTLAEYARNGIRVARIW